MERRSFIKRTGASSAFIGLGGLGLSACSGPEVKHLTILHTNDVHSHIDPFPADHSAFPLKGGIARRAALIEEIRRENPNTLLFDAGDIFQGTPYFNFYGGELEFKLMSMMRYDAATIGNHDFDNGLEGFLAQLPHANFPFLSANYDFTDTILDGMVRPYKVFERDGLKIGVFGLGIMLKGIVNDALYGETRYLDPIEMAQEMSDILKKEERCHVVICLSHLGYEYKRGELPSDLDLAAATRGIDLIIGGHTHTFLDRPVVKKNRDQQDVLVNQAGCYGVNMGRIDFYFDNDGIRANGTTVSV
ncbi:bifunctional metallophosphatase/5'-nucleotidase [Zeaxanthinibacter enoshimensis]|uniref:5'-nucleotidase n=1 Tax=Zeaxanthinibacter enoshimensis TaxID=392009 RepID=A0A4V3D3X0_9FLAO|nr:metallophosphatase [Zeaxanthinibacter enoshimensis]TDQ31633.1 5'-nucleotidase [Zeaxanthinibacter enoshimensis]